MFGLVFLSSRCSHFSLAVVSFVDFKVIYLSDIYWACFSLASGNVQVTPFEYLVCCRLNDAVLFSVSRQNVNLNDPCSCCIIVLYLTLVHIHSVIVSVLEETAVMYAISPTGIDKVFLILFVGGQLRSTSPTLGSSSLQQVTKNQSSYICCDLP